MMTGQGDMTWAWGATSGAVAGWSFVPYLRGIRRDPSVRPSPLSWLIWAALDVLLTGSQYARGGRASLVLAAADAAGCAVIFVLAWRRGWAVGAGPRWRRGWQALGAGAGDAMPPPVTAAVLAAVTGALIAWHFAGPAVAIALALAVNGTAGAVTAIKVAAHPASEPLASWWWYGTAAALAMPAVGPSGGILYANPVCGLALTTAVIACARLGRHDRPARLSLLSLVATDLACSAPAGMSPGTQPGWGTIRI